MRAFVIQGLLNEFLESLNILFIDNFGQNSECVSFDYIWISLLDVFAKAWDNDEDLAFRYFKFFNEDVNQSAEVLVLGWVSLEKFSNVEE